jgi:hypothetical protein
VIAPGKEHSGGDALDTVRDGQGRRAHSLDRAVGKDLTFKKERDEEARCALFPTNYTQN